MTVLADYLEPPDAGELFSDARWLTALVDFEVALAQAQADCGLIPRTAAEAIARAAAAVVIDPAAFTARARESGAIGVALVEPLQAWLRDHAAEALPWLHRGTTTQDAVDTANAVLTRHAVAAVRVELVALRERLQAIAGAHAATPILARSLMQPAQITTFGLKCAQAAAAVERSRRSLDRLADHALCTQLGGAVGNRAGLGEHADAIESGLARRLGLRARGHGWHTQRDEPMRLAAEAGICAGTLGKLAHDWALLGQFEVNEVRVASRGPTSSAMPHKRNPVELMRVVAATTTVPGLVASLLATMNQAHERALGQWQAELVEWRRLWRQLYSAATAMRLAADGIEVDAPRMAANVDALQQVVHSEACSRALGAIVGVEAARAAVADLAPRALASRQPLAELLLGWVRSMAPGEVAKATEALGRAVDPGAAIGASASACRGLLDGLEPSGDEQRQR